MQPPVTHQSAVCVGPTGIGGQYREVWRKRRGHRGLVWPLDELGRSWEVRCHREDEDSVSPCCRGNWTLIPTEPLSSFLHLLSVMDYVWKDPGKKRNSKKPTCAIFQALGTNCSCQKQVFCKCPLLTRTYALLIWCHLLCSVFLFCGNSLPWEQLMMSGGQMFDIFITPALLITKNFLNRKKPLKMLAVLISMTKTWSWLKYTQNDLFLSILYHINY